MPNEILQNNVHKGTETGLISRWHLLDEKYDSKSTIFSIVLMFLLSINFLLFGIDRINRNTNPEAFDTVAFLGEANIIKDNGGIKNFLNLCITGKYKQANQHPLYILVLSPFASRDISFFVNAKIISFVIGLILILLLFIIARKNYGDLCASVAVLGLLFNHQFLLWTSIVACESLIMLFSLLCMFLVLKGFENAKCWSYAGIFAGLAYLTKGTGLFLIPGFALSALTAYGLKVFKNKYVWSFFILFTLVASPLIIRNIVLYHNPFYNVNMDRITYQTDKLNESKYVLFKPDESMGIHVYPESESKDSLSKPSNAEFFRRLGKKAISGVVAQTEAFLGLLGLCPISYFLVKVVKLPLYSDISTTFRIVLGFFLFSFFVIGIVREKEQARMVYVFTTLLTFVVGLAFFRPILRYFLPILPFIWIYVALGILTILDIFQKGFLSNISNLSMILYIPRVLAITCILLIGYALATLSLSSPTKSVDFSDSRLDLLNWLRANLNENETYIEGPNFNWQLEKGTWVLPPVNKRESLEEFNSFVKQHDINYVIIDWYSLTVSRYRGGGIDRRKKLEGYFELDPKKGIVQKKNVGDWQLIYKDPRRKVEFMVFKPV